MAAGLSFDPLSYLHAHVISLQYATSHIDAQILILRDFISSLQSSDHSSGSDTLVSPSHMRTLTDVRRDVVQTIRQVVDVVSKYAGGALPEPARSRVRRFILHLPHRWANASIGTAPGMADGVPGSNSAVGAAAGGSGSGRRGRNARHHKERSAGGPDRSQADTPGSSRAPSPLPSARVGLGASHRPTASAATHAAQRILTLATESLDMMRGVASVVKDSLDRADAYVNSTFSFKVTPFTRALSSWVERLRVVGLQRQQSNDNPGPSDLTSSFTQHRSQSSLPGLTSTPSTPFSSIPSTPAAYSPVPATPPAAYTIPDTLAMGIRLNEAGAQKSLSDLRLDGDAVCDAPRTVTKDMCEERKPDRIREKQNPENTAPVRDGMTMDDG